MGHVWRKGKDAAASFVMARKRESMVGQPLAGIDFSLTARVSFDSK
jgi:hypothetical protein